VATGCVGVKHFQKWNGRHCLLQNILAVLPLQEMIHTNDCGATKRLFICKLAEEETDHSEAMRLILDKN
jgi:hypothetical protein